MSVVFPFAPAVWSTARRSVERRSGCGQAKRAVTWARRVAMPEPLDPQAGHVRGVGEERRVRGQESGVTGSPTRATTLSRRPRESSSGGVLLIRRVVRLGSDSSSSEDEDKDREDEEE